MESTNRVGNLIVYRRFITRFIYTEDYRKEYLYDLATIYSLIANQKIENMLDDRD
jgi:hypothetical protein